MPKGLLRRAGDIGSRLSLASDRLDRLCRDVSLGVRDQRQFDELESDAQAIAADIVAAFRQPEPRPGGCTNLPKMMRRVRGL